MSFAAALTFTLAREGGKVENSLDPGGRTNLGVTQRVWDAWRATNPELPADVWDATSDQVAQLYLQQYWTAVGCDALPDGPALAVFDTAVNLGVARAVAMWHGANGDLNAFLWGRVAYYDDLVRAKPAEQIFLSGWIRRVLLLREATL